MTIYIIEVEYKNHKTGEKIFTKTSAIAYPTLEEAITFVRAQSDYQASLNSHLHYGRDHNYTIRGITLKGVKMK